MRYQPLPADFHAANRAQLAHAIGPEAIAIIDTTDVLTRNNDCTYPFRPDSNAYYLTGIAEPEAVLVLAPGSSDPALRELLFIKQADDHAVTWEGERHTQDEARARSGIQSVYWLSELEPLLDRLLNRYPTIYLNAVESLSAAISTPATRRATLLRERFPLHQLRSALPQLAQQRLTKHPAEVEQIKRAIAITRAGLLRAWASLKPGLPEYALEAELGAEFTRQGASHAFMPIVAAGAHATTIHYMRNDATIAKADLVLFDVGAEVGWYAADISRVVPASGRYTPRQRAVYQAVRRVQQAAIQLHQPGTSIWDIDEQIRLSLLEELASLGIITASQARAQDKFHILHQYYGHMSHHLGLDVHDPASPRTTLQPGMVVTCEPGLYLREEGIGIRLEDDILITESGHKILSATIPNDPDQLEALIQKGHP